MKVNLYWGRDSSDWLANNHWNFGLEEYQGIHPATESKYIEYCTEPTDIGIFVDYDGNIKNLETLVKSSNHKYKIMVLMEPYSFNRALNKFILENENLFDYIIAHYPEDLQPYQRPSADKNALGSCRWYTKNPEKYRYYIGGSRTMIKPDERGFNINLKPKNICTIWSDKNFGLVGHDLRHEMIDWLKVNRPGVVDFHNPKEKIDVLKDYRYEIVVENEFPYFLSEKHIDAILTGTLPIVWGSPDTIQWKGFNTDGMVFFETADDLYKLLDSGMFTEDFYKGKVNALIHNYYEVQKHLSFGDIMWDSILKEIY